MEERNLQEGFPGLESLFTQRNENKSSNTHSGKIIPCAGGAGKSKEKESAGDLGGGKPPSGWELVEGKGVCEHINHHVM